MVLELLLCVDGLATLFKKTKDSIIPSVKSWLNHVVELFLEQTSKKRGIADVDTQKVFQTIENLKLHILEGRYSLSEISSSGLNSPMNVRFDANHPDSLSKLRKATEELFFLCNQHQTKPKISSYICGHPGAVAPNVLKATKDLLHQLYMMQEVLKADKHLEKIMDFSDMSLREREIEVTGSVALNRGNAVALQLAHGAINSSYGGSLEPVFTALQLFDGASEKLLNVYRSQLIFQELKDTALEGLEELLDEICKQAVTQAKMHACVVCQDVPPSVWVDELSGVPRRASNKFDCIFRKKTLSLAGFDVEIETALIDRLNSAVKSDYEKIFHQLEITKDPTLISSSHMRLEILKGAHEWLSTKLSIAPWDACTEEEREVSTTVTRRVSTVVCDCIVQKLFRDFNYDMRSRRFKSFQENEREPFSFKISARPSTPKIRFDIRAGIAKDSAAFGFQDICVIHEMMSLGEIENLVMETQRFIVKELHEFMEVHLSTLLEFIPLELIDLRIADLSAAEELTAIECLSFVLEKFGTDITETPTWMDPLRSLERIGNGVVFLHLMQICLQKNDAAHSIQHCGSPEEIGHFFDDIGINSGTSFGGEVDTGNPFEMELRKKRGTFREKSPPPKLPSPSRILRECIEVMSIVVEESEQRQRQRRLNIKNAISIVLLLKTYAQANAQLINVTYGDGVLWAANLIAQLCEQGQNFERVDWIHEILRLSQMDDVQFSVQTPNDIRSFLTHAQRITATWRHLSHFRVYQSLHNKTEMSSSSDEAARADSLKMIEDSPLRGFFGGMCHIPMTAKRRSTHDLSWSMGPLRASMMRNKAFNAVSTRDASYVQI